MDRDVAGGPGYTVTLHDERRSQAAQLFLPHRDVHQATPSYDLNYHWGIGRMDECCRCSKTDLRARGLDLPFEEDMRKCRRSCNVLKFGAATMSETM